MKTDIQLLCGSRMRMKWSLVLPIGIVLAATSLSGCKPKPKPTPKLTAAEELDLFVTGLAQSGPVHQTLADVMEANATLIWKDTNAAVDKYLARPPKSGASTGIEPKIRCFKKGCMWDVAFSDRTTATQVVQMLISDRVAPFRSWPGSAYFGPLVEQKDGSGVKTTWALLIEKRQYDQLRPISALNGNQPPGFPSKQEPRTPPSSGALVNKETEGN